jgi:hypothetical protein
VAFKVKAIPSGGSYFKAEEHRSAVALLVEPTKFVKDGNKRQDGTLSDMVVANVTVFMDRESLNAGKPSKVLSGTRVTNQVLCSSLEDLVGEATIATLDKRPTKNNNQAWYWSQVTDADTVQKVVTYGEAREAELEAAAASMPDF